MAGESMAWSARKSPQGPLSVGQLVDAIRTLIEGHPRMGAVAVFGELSGVKHHASGHWYFQLKDERASLRAVMFRREAAALDFHPEDGQAVLAWGRVGVFERDGQTQLYVRRMQPMGVGQAFLRLEALKAKLEAEGVFQRAKRPLPRLPRAVGVVTSASGAAIHDIQTVIGRRYPGMPVVLEPVTVQGPNAPAAIAEAIWRIQTAPIDVLIVGRGGGSREDLMAFNAEAVVRAVAACRVPVIAAVGHEIDFTLADLAADVRAPTPSAAAELAVPERDRLAEQHRHLRRRSRQALQRRLEWERSRLAGWVGHGILSRPDRLLSDAWTALERLEERAGRALERRLQGERTRYERLAARAAALNPEAPLQRGYALVQDEHGEPVTAAAVAAGRRYRVRWRDGQRWVRAEGDEEA